MNCLVWLGDTPLSSKKGKSVVRPSISGSQWAQNDLRLRRDQTLRNSALHNILFCPFTKAPNLVFHTVLVDVTLSCKFLVQKCESKWFDTQSNYGTSVLGLSILQKGLYKSDCRCENCKFDSQTSRGLVWNCISFHLEGRQIRTLLTSSVPLPLFTPKGIH